MAVAMAAARTVAEIAAATAVAACARPRVMAGADTLLPATEAAGGVRRRAVAELHTVAVADPRMAADHPTAVVAADMGGNTGLGFSRVQ